jgi:eukaryotic-like serine/threonine-protein kinase
MIPAAKAVPGRAGTLSGVRSAVADYRAIQALSPGAAGRSRFVCRAPDRLRLGPDPVTVELLPTGRWQQAAAALQSFASVRSEYLVRLLEVGPEPSGGFYVASEDGGTTLAQPGRQLSSAEIVHAVARAALGAHDLHEAGIAHGWIGPLSIHPSDRGAVLGPPPAGAPAGVLGIMSAWQDLVTIDPDLLRGYEPSRASDIWSLGATLHLCLSPRPMFGGIADDAPASAVQRMMYTRPEVDRSLPGGLADLVAACLAPDPLSRPSTAAEIAGRLGGEVGR